MEKLPVTLEEINTFRIEGLAVAGERCRLAHPKLCGLRGLMGDESSLPPWPMSW